MAYIARNPVRAGLVEQADSYAWSSAKAHTSGEDRTRMVNLDDWRRQYTGERWREVLRTSVSEEALMERLREASVRGRPLGSEDFLEAMERKAGRRLRPLPVGRPKKSDDACERQRGPIATAAHNRYLSVLARVSPGFGTGLAWHGFGGRVWRHGFGGTGFGSRLRDDGGSSRDQRTGFECDNPVS